MKRRILGFQRRVWCPKWTPAARSSSSVGWEPPDFCDSILLSTSSLVFDVGGLHRIDRPIARHQSLLHPPERLPCHPERSEGSACCERKQIVRCAHDDRGVLNAC